MSRLKSISEIINNKDGKEYDKLLEASAKARPKRKREKELQPPHIGHILAVMVFEGIEHLETFFIDNIDICERHTVFWFTQSYMEVYPVGVEVVDVSLGRAKVSYKNNTSIEIIRIS